MRILLVGEYNRSHYFLKEGLQLLGYEVTNIGLTDGFKKVEVDIEIKHHYQTYFRKIARTVLYKLLKIDLHSLSVKKQIIRLSSELSNYDCVQFINESSFLCLPDTEIWLFDFIKARNKKVFLLSCGTDYISVMYAYKKQFRYSILTPLFENKISNKDYYPILKYIKPLYIKLHEHIFSHIDGVIASDLDYHLPLIGYKKYLGMVPNPINTDKIAYIKPVIDGKIKIFHGINLSNYYKKGNDIFEKALDIISLKYNDKIEIKTIKNLPYKEYITAFDDAHILLDMVYAYDQGFNALEAMAKGKVVFTGAEQEWLEYYQLEEDTIAVNALPDASAIAKKLEWLIENPNKIVEISLNARAFIEKEHHYLNSAKGYLEKWNITN